MGNQPVSTDIARCRAAMAELLNEAIATTRKLKRRLDVMGGWPEISARIDLGADPAHATTRRLPAASQGADTHAHRPASERQEAKSAARYATQAQAAAAASCGAATPKKQNSWSLRQADKMATLPRGREWNYPLSGHFGHAATADWRRVSSHGGLMSMHTVQDQRAFPGFMDYPVEQVARMNSAAALCPVEEDANHTPWKGWGEPALAEQTHVRVASTALLDAAKAALTREPDASARTG